MQGKRLKALIEMVGGHVDLLHSNEVFFYHNGKYSIYYNWDTKCYNLKRGYRGEILINNLPFKEFKKEFLKLF